MKLHFVVISLFREQEARRAVVGPKDPNISRHVLGETLGRWGIKVPGANREMDPMYYLVLGKRPIGYVRVFDDERWARNWFNGLRDKKNAWGFWRDGRPLVWDEGSDLRANQFVTMMVICRIRAFTAHAAAEKVWQGYMSGRLYHMELYLDPVAHPPSGAGRPISTEDAVDKPAPTKVLRSSSPDSEPPIEATETSDEDEAYYEVEAEETNDTDDEEERVATPVPTGTPVDPGKWQVDGRAIFRTYRFLEFPSPEINTSLTIRCSLSKYLSGSIGTYLAFQLRPYLHLRFDRNPLDEDLQKGHFSVGLAAEGSGEGTEASPLFLGGMEEVSACCMGENEDAAMLDVASDFGLKLFLQILSCGRPMTFSLWDGSKTKKLSLRLPSDHEFGRLYSSVRERM